MASTLLTSPSLLALCLAVAACSDSRESVPRVADAATDDTPAAPAAKSGPEDPAEFPAAPGFTLPNVAGGTLALSELQGKVVLIDFWATWCPPCRAGIPHLNELYRSKKDAGLVIVGVSVDRGNPAKSGVDMVREFKTRIPMDYPQVMADANIVQAYGGIQSIPTAFLVDRAGRVRKKYVGLQPREIFEKDIAPLLSEPPPETDGSI